MRPSSVSIKLVVLIVTLCRECRSERLRGEQQRSISSGAIDLHRLFNLNVFGQDASAALKSPVHTVTATAVSESGKVTVATKESLPSSSPIAGNGDTTLRDRADKTATKAPKKSIVKPEPRAIQNKPAKPVKPPININAGSKQTIPPVNEVVSLLPSSIAPSDPEPKSRASKPPKTKSSVQIVYKTYAPVESPQMEPPVVIVYKTQAPRAPRHKTPHPTELSLEAPVVPLTKAPVPPPTKAPIVDITVSPTLAPSFPPKVVPVSTEPGTDDHVEGEDALPGYQPPNAEKGLPEPVSGDDLALQEEEMALAQVEKEAKTAGGLGILLAMCAMIFTAYQMSENPDGIFASVCRLAITLIGCGFKMVTMPCRNLLGNRYHGGHIPVSTMEYREPYRGSGNMMEMT